MFLQVKMKSLDLIDNLDFEGSNASKIRLLVNNLLLLLLDLLVIEEVHAHRKAMLANMACSLIEHKRINTTC